LRRRGLRRRGLRRVDVRGRGFRGSRLAGRAFHGARLGGCRFRGRGFRCCRLGRHRLADRFARGGFLRRGLASAFRGRRKRLTRLVFQQLCFGDRALPESRFGRRGASGRSVFGALLFGRPLGEGGGLRLRSGHLARLIPGARRTGLRSLPLPGVLCQPAPAEIGFHRPKPTDYSVSQLNFSASKVWSAKDLIDSSTLLSISSTLVLMRRSACSAKTVAISSSFLAPSAPFPRMLESTRLITQASTNKSIMMSAKRRVANCLSMIARPCLRKMRSEALARSRVPVSSTVATPLRFGSSLVNVVP